MSEFLEFLDNLRHRTAIHIEITYSRITDWRVYIYKKGAKDLYPDAQHNLQGDVEILSVQDNDLELCMAKAHVALKEWLLKYNGGY